ncbi:MAG: GNAT family N-acetyltransferase [Chitinophagales bacterium]
MSYYNNIHFADLSEEHLEMLRNWRNTDEVKQFLVNKNHIKADEQIKWFAELDKRKNIYYIVYYENTAIGCASLVNIDYKKKTAQPGFFIGNIKFRNHPVAVFSVYKLIERAFNDLKLNHLESVVLAENKSAIQLYRFLGFGLTPINTELMNSKISRKQFYNNQSVIKKKLFGN